MYMYIHIYISKLRKKRNKKEINKVSIICCASLVACDEIALYLIFLTYL